MPAFAIAPEVNPYQILENGHVLVLPDLGIRLTAEERALVQSTHETGTRHKNIAYKPLRGTVTGLGREGRSGRDAFARMLRRYSDAALAYAAKLLPQYRSAWRLDYASLRPVEEAGRVLPFKQRNDLIHTDAFPTRPTRGGLILRIFWNLHPSRARVWVTADPFAVLAPRYAAAAGLHRFAQRPWSAKALLHALGIPVRLRSPYDCFMLAFHDFLKGNTEFQLTTRKYRLVFPPGSAWMAFTDMVPHAVESGQYAMEQTVIVPPAALTNPACAPLSILEKLAGRALV